MADEKKIADSENVPIGYVLDASAIINLEKKKLIAGLESPGDWIMVATIVAGEINPDFPGTPEATKQWLRSGKITGLTTLEEATFRKLILKPGMDPGESQAIAVAYSRHKTLVIDEKKTGSVWGTATGMGIRCIDSSQFINEIKPSFPGF